MTLGEKIKAFREQRGLSQREFARRCDLSNVAIASIENGFRSDGKEVAPKFETIRKIARAMGTSAEALITQCDDFLLDISDSTEETPAVKQFIEQQAQRSPDEEILLMTYRLIPVEHRAEVLQAALQVKMKYEN